jgi:hypothetical protein
VSSPAPTAARDPSGYAHRAYAESLAEVGTPRPLSGCGGWLLERPVPGTPYRDAMGCYPLFACADWSRLPDDLEALGHELVSVALVADPFGDADPWLLRRCFDQVVAFKEHFVVDLERPAAGDASSHHRRQLRRALREVQVDWVQDPRTFAAEWVRLYGCLVQRHHVRGVAAFSPAALAGQLAVPGVSVLRASRDGETVGATVWLRRGDVAYYHLGAYSDAGYRCRASFALFRTAIESFARTGARWLDLGAGAGVRTTPAEDGLTRFKRGWANASRTAYFCGRIVAPAIYHRLSEAVPATGYFPAYRAGEFA